MLQTCCTVSVWPFTALLTKNRNSLRVHWSSMHYAMILPTARCRTAQTQAIKLTWTAMCNTSRQDNQGPRQRCRAQSPAPSGVPKTTQIWTSQGRNLRGSSNKLLPHDWINWSGPSADGGLIQTCKLLQALKRADGVYLRRSMPRPELQALASAARQVARDIIDAI